MNKRRFKNKPGPPAGPFELQITDLAADARGVGHSGGKAVFVSDSLPGEKISYMRTRQHRNHDEGELHSLLEPAPERVTPRCQHFGYCGGCALQHYAPEAQIAFKQSQLLTTLERIGKVKPDTVLPPLTGAIWGYRRRARLAVKYVPKKGGALVGFRERSTSYVAVLEHCDVLVPEVGERLSEIQALLNELSICHRVPQIEIAAGDNAIALVLQVLSPPTQADREKLIEYSRNSGLWFYLQPGGQDTVKPLLEDTPGLFYDLPEYDLQLGFNPTDFLQIHGEINQKLIQQAVSLLALSADDEVLELFAGIGNFSLPLARAAGQVISVEGEAELVERAKLNASKNAITNLEALKGDLFANSDDFGWSQRPFNKVLLDPPRAGAREVIPVIAARAPSHILYCSCHPATLARDAATLVHEHGYKLAAAGVVDMFPHTAHAEAMALFERV